MANSNVPLIFQPLARYADFNGRSRRSEYWLWALFLFLVNSALSIVQFSLMGASMASTQGGPHSGAAMASAFGAGAILSLIRMAVFFGLLLPSIAVAVRRMHDINRTGWWILLPSVVGVVAIVVVFSLNGSNLLQQMRAMHVGDSSDPRAAIGMLMSMMQTLMWVILPTLAAKVVTFVFRVTEGTRGPNRYGPDPKGAAPTNLF